MWQNGLFDTKVWIGCLPVPSVALPWVYWIPAQSMEGLKFYTRPWP